jgi:hypothetical protein
MHAPPPVHIDVMPGWRWRAAQALASAAAGAVMAWWAAAQWPAGPGTVALATALGAAVAAALGWRAARSESGRLAWTGAQWQWTPHAAAVAAPLALRVPLIAFDLDHAMWLRLQPLAGGRPSWLAVTRPDAALQWAAFRAAVYFPASKTGMRSPAERRIP